MKNYTFHAADGGEYLDTRPCEDLDDAKEHGAHLACEYGGDVQVKNMAGKTLSTVSEEYFDTVPA